MVPTVSVKDPSVKGHKATWVRNATRALLYKTEDGPNGVTAMYQNDILVAAKKDINRRLTGQLVARLQTDPELRGWAEKEKDRLGVGTLDKWHRENLPKQRADTLKVGDRVVFGGEDSQNQGHYQITKIEPHKTTDDDLSWGQYAPKDGAIDVTISQPLDTVVGLPEGSKVKGDPSVITLNRDAMVQMDRVSTPDDEIRAAIGIRVRGAIDSWARSAGDGDPESIAVQRAAAEHFGMDPATMDSLKEYASGRPASGIMNTPFSDLFNGPHQALANDLQPGDKVQYQYMGKDAWGQVEAISPSGQGHVEVKVKNLKTAALKKIVLPGDTVMQIKRIGLPGEGDDAWSVSGRLLDRDRTFYDAFVGQVYDNTQADLKAKGIDHVILERGAYWDPNDEKTPAWVLPPVKGFEPITKRTNIEDLKPGDVIALDRDRAVEDKLGAGSGGKDWATVIKVDVNQENEHAVAFYDNIVVHTDKGDVTFKWGKSLYDVTMPNGSKHKSTLPNVDAVANYSNGQRSGGNVIIDLTPRQVQATLNPLSSWTADHDVAKDFTHYGAGNESGVLFRAAIPAERIWSLSSSSGAGALREREAIVIGPEVTADMAYIGSQWGANSDTDTEGSYFTDHPEKYGVDVGKVKKADDRNLDADPHLADWIKRRPDISVDGSTITPNLAQRPVAKALLLPLATI